MSTWKTVRFSLLLVDSKARLAYFRVLILQLFLPLIDLAGIVILGFVSLGLTGKQNENYPKILNHFFQYLDEVTKSDTKYGIVFLIGVALILFTLKGLLAITSVRQTYLILADASYRFSVNLSKRFFSQTISGIQRRSSFETSDALNSACNFQIIGVLGSASTFLGEFMLLIVLGCFMIAMNPIIAILSVSYFYLVFLVMQRYLLRISDSAGNQRAQSLADNTKTIQEAIGSFRELYVGNLMEPMLQKYRLSRLMSAHSHWKTFWVSVIPKYLFESALMLGVGGLATLQFITSDLSASTFTLSAFLIVGTRALPSILRIQSASNTIAGSQGSSIYLRQMLQDIEMHPLVSVPDDFRILSSSDFEPTVIVENLSFTYEDATIPALKIDRLKLDAGERLAIVGPSGSGKSTLADLLLGVLDPQYGHVFISGKFPREVVRAWPGKVSYVPQSLSLLDGSIFQNIALFQDSSTEAVSKVWTCLEKAQLGPYVSSLPKGLETEIGERGIKLSGGQKQRIALARALFTDPELIILDEATSALDAQTEDLVRIAINNLGKDVSIVVIAHRLSTIRDFQRILYLDSGIILADGSFDEVRSIIPQFEQQAKLSGLDSHQ